jgi:hypothetical protein
MTCFDTITSNLTSHSSLALKTPDFDFLNWSDTFRHNIVKSIAQVSYNVKNQLHAPFTYIKIFNYNPTCFKPLTGSSSGMSQITITHKMQQHRYNFWIQLLKIQLLKYR